MPSLTDYIKGLQNDYAQNNIYSQLGGSILGANVNIQGGSPYANFATNLFKGLVGGGLNRMGVEDNREYNAGINSVLKDTLSGSPIAPVEGVSESELNNLANSLSILKNSAAEESKLAGLLKEKENFGAVKGQLDAQSESFNKMGGNPLLNPNNPLASQIQKETNIAETKKQSFDFIDNAFEKAKELVGPGAAIPTAIGGSKDELTGLGDSLVIQIDAAVGRELNSDVRQRLLNLAPKWYDSASQLDEKKIGLKALLESLSAPTPTLDRLGITSSTSINTPKPSSTLTPEQARAILRQKGIPGY